MRPKKTVAATVGAALAAAAATTAIAAPGNSPLGLIEDRDELRAEHAKALGEKLDVEPARVHRALREVHRERHEAHEDEMAKALSEKLGVSAGDAERALERAFASVRTQRVEPAPAPGERPEGVDPHRELAQAIAKELDKGADEVGEALRAIHVERLERHLEEAVEARRLTREQADEIREHARSGPAPRFGRRPRGVPGPGLGPPPGAGPGPGDVVLEFAPPPVGPEEGS